MRAPRAPFGEKAVAFRAWAAAAEAEEDEKAAPFRTWAAEAAEAADELLSLAADRDLAVAALEVAEAEAEAEATLDERVAAQTAEAKHGDLDPSSLALVGTPGASPAPLLPLAPPPLLVLSLQLPRPHQHELVEVDAAVAVDVSRVEHAPNLSERRRAAAGDHRVLRHQLGELFKVEHAVPVVVKAVEDLRRLEHRRVPRAPLPSLERIADRARRLGALEVETEPRPEPGGSGGGGTRFRQDRGNRAQKRLPVGVADQVKQLEGCEQRWRRRRRRVALLTHRMMRCEIHTLRISPYERQTMSSV